MDTKTLAEKTEGFSGVEIASVCNNAALMAVGRAMASAADHPEADVPVQVMGNETKRGVPSSIRHPFFLPG